MKKDLIIHCLYLIAFLVLISVVRGWLKLAYLPFWFGGIIGTLLPYVDYLIFAYLIAPEETASKEAVNLVSQGKIATSVGSLFKVRNQGRELIMHTAYFQIILMLFTFFIITSSGSILGRGLVLAFSLHLFIDEVIDLMEVGNLDNWFKNFSFTLDKSQRRWYLGANFVLLLIFGFIL